MIGMLANHATRMTPDSGNDHEVDVIDGVQWLGGDGEPTLRNEQATARAKTLELQSLHRALAFGLRCTGQNFHGQGDGRRQHVLVYQCGNAKGRC